MSTLVSQKVGVGGQTVKVAMTTTSAQSSAIGTAVGVPANATPFQHVAPFNGEVTVYVDALCFVRQGANPTALLDGTDQPLAIGHHRLEGITPGNKLAFIVPSGTGSAYITPGV